MARPSRKTGINGARLRYLRQKEQWTQTDLADRLGIHRSTLARWEAGVGNAPYAAAEQLAELFKVVPGFLFHLAPIPDLEGTNPEGIILDPALKRFPLGKLQKNTRPALEASGFTLKQLTRKLPKVPVERLQGLLDGQKPTAAEIQLLWDNLGADFNPISPKRPKYTDYTDEKAKAKLELLMLLAELVVRAVEQTSITEQLNGKQKKQQALEQLGHMAEGLELTSLPALLDALIEASLQRIKSGQPYTADLKKKYDLTG